MQDAWDLQPPVVREVDETETFILFGEDEVNEPSYFLDLQVEKKVKINFVEDQKSGFQNYVNAVAYCLNNGLMETVNNVTALKAGITQHIWCVYDRDCEEENFQNIPAAKNHTFDLAIQSGLASGLKVAWSNDVFELWILLHFEDVTPGVWRHRTYVYDRLTQIFRDLPNQTEEMAQETSKPRFNYKGWMKRKKNFILFVRPLLKERRADAIQRANQLEAAFPANADFHKRNPCTQIHHLVQSIMSFY